MTAAELSVYLGSPVGLAVASAMMAAGLVVLWRDCGAPRLRRRRESRRRRRLDVRPPALLIPDPADFASAVASSSAWVVPEYVVRRPYDWSRDGGDVPDPESPRSAEMAARGAGRTRRGPA